MESRPTGTVERAVSWGILLALTVWLAWTWAPAFGLPLGDNHEGRILSEFGIRVRNFWEMGAAGSSWGGDWTPFSDKPYNHHPPFLHVTHVVVSWIFGQGVAQLKSIGYLSGLLTVPAFAYMGRRLGLRPITAALATGVVVITPFFWLYARLGLGMLPLALMIGTIYHLASEEDPSPWLVWATAGAAFFAVSSSWQGLILGAVLGLWLLYKRRIDRPTLVVGVAMGFAALIVFAWTLTGPGIGDLAEHAANRWEFPWTIEKFLRRQWFFAEALLPTRYHWLLLASLPFGLFHRKTRFLTWVVVLWTAGFMFGPSDNAWIHDYWNFYGFLAVIPSVGVMLEVFGGLRTGDRGLRTEDDEAEVGSSSGSRLGSGLGLGPIWRTVVVLAALALTIIWTQEIGDEEFHARYFDHPSRAGALLMATEPAPGQELGWYLNPIPHVTWMSYHWEIHPEEATIENVEQVPAADVVLVRTDRIPQWLSPELANEAIVRDGRYALVTGDQLRAHVLETDS